MPKIEGGRQMRKRLTQKFFGLSGQTFVPAGRPYVKRNLLSLREIFGNRKNSFHLENKLFDSLMPKESTPIIFPSMGDQETSSSTRQSYLNATLAAKSRLSSNSTKDYQLNLLTKKVERMRLLSENSSHFEEKHQSLSIDPKLLLGFRGKFLKHILKDVKIGAMTQKDLNVVLKWAEKEGWNPGRFEMKNFLKVEPECFRMMKWRDTPIACFAVFKHSEQFAYIGLYIVKTGFRGLGFGKILWDNTMKNLSPSMTIALNADPLQGKLYQNDGFSSAEMFTRFKGNIPNNKEVKISKLPKDVTLLPKSDIKVSFDSLLKYDTGIFKIPRESFLKSWLSMEESHTLCAMKGTEVKGYGVISKCVNGYKIGPLFADNKSIAENLLIGLCKRIDQTDSSVQIDISLENQQAVELAKKYKLKEVMKIQRMYRNEDPQMDNQKTFASATLEHG